MTRKSALLIGFVLLLFAVAVSLWTYPHLPDRVPTHWDLGGNVNRYSSRFFAVALLPGLVAIVWLLMLLLPMISPRGFRLEGCAGAFYVSFLAILAFLFVLQVIIVRAQLGAAGPPNNLLFLTIGALFAVLGTQLGRFDKNFFIGVRTPWTLASDEVWRRTNTLIGRLLAAGGLLLMAVSPFTGLAIAILIALAAAIVVVSLGYSYVLYLRIEGFGSDDAV
jgi:uncharacterized membrane protein